MDIENYKLYGLHNDIMILIGQYGVTPGAAYFIMKDITNELYKIYLEQVEKEAQVLKAENEKAETAEAQQQPQEEEKE